MNEVLVRNALRRARTIFDHHELRVWLDSGTLLGAARDGRIIPWDDDVDLSVWADEFEQIDQAGFWQQVRANGFDGYMLADKLVLEADGVPLNVSLYYRDQNMATRPIYPLHTNAASKLVRVLWWVLNVRRPPGKPRSRRPMGPTAVAKRVLPALADLLPRSLHDRLARQSHQLCLAAGCVDVQWSVPMRFFEQLGKLEMYDEYWDVPVDLDGYLRFRYGDDWRHPRRDWVTTVDDGGVHRVSAR